MLDKMEQLSKFLSEPTRPKRVDQLQGLESNPSAPQPKHRGKSTSVIPKESTVHCLKSFVTQAPYLHSSSLYLGGVCFYVWTSRYGNANTVSSGELE